MSKPSSREVKDPGYRYAVGFPKRVRCLWLGCKKTFVSQHPGVRYCPHCRNTALEAARNGGKVRTLVADPDGRVVYGRTD